MSWHSLLPEITGGVTFLAAVGGLVKSWQNSHKLVDIHLTMNSRLDELIKASRAQGRQEERDSHMIVVEGVPDPNKP